MENIVNCGILDHFEDQNFDTFDIVSNNLILAPKVPRYAYGIMSNKIPPKRNQNFWRVHLKIFVIKKMRSGNKFIVVT